MTELNVGFCEFSEEFLDDVIALNRRYPETPVTELYGSIRGLGATARSQDRIPDKKLADLEVLVQKMASAGMTLKWTLNFSCFGGLQDLNWPKYHAMLSGLWEIGVRKFIITLPIVAELVKRDFPDATIEVSTISRITSRSALEKWFRLGADGACWDVMENRNFKLLREACSLANSMGKYVEVLVNEFCTYQCIYRNHCYCLSSHNSTRDMYGGYPFGRCIEERRRDPWKWIQARFVLPEHLPYYKRMGVRKFKISGRTWPREKVLPIIERYMKGESPDNLLELWPHINPLVDDPTRPEQDLVISTEYLKGEAFLRYFESVNCSIECQKSCHFCNGVFEQTTGRGAGRSVC